MHLDFFSATFYSFRRHIKTEFRLLTSDLSQYYFESLFIMMIQLILSLAYLSTQNEIQIFTIDRNAGLYICMFFASMFVHFNCVCTMRNAMKIVQHVCFHSQEYDQPGWMLFMGCSLCISTFLCELVNIVNFLTQKDV